MARDNDGPGTRSPGQPHNNVVDRCGGIGTPHPGVDRCRLLNFRSEPQTRQLFQDIIAHFGVANRTHRPGAPGDLPKVRHCARRRKFAGRGPADSRLRRVVQVEAGTGHEGKRKKHRERFERPPVFRRYVYALIQYGLCFHLFSSSDSIVASSSQTTLRGHSPTAGLDPRLSTKGMRIRTPGFDLIELATTWALREGSNFKAKNCENGVPRNP